MSSSPRPVLILAYPGCQVLDVVGPHEVFAGANSWMDAHDPGSPRYRPLVVAETAGPVRTESGVAIVADRALGDLAPMPPSRPGSPARTSGDGSAAEAWWPAHTVIVPGGDGVHDACRSTSTISWLTAAAADATRTASVCSGTFLLGAAGLLAGRRVTTHWARADLLARRHPDAIVDADAIHLVDGPIWSSAGVTAGIDLALAMVEADIGADCAQTVARWLVVFVRRPGGQSQFAAPVWTDPPDHDGVRAAVRAVRADPCGDHAVDALATVASMSPRHFTRVFTATMGVSPGRYVEQARLDAARALLERTALAVDVVARRSGFGSDETMRRVFARRLGCTPGDYRARFALGSPHSDTHLRDTHHPADPERIHS